MTIALVITLGVLGIVAFELRSMTKSLEDEETLESTGISNNNAPPIIDPDDTDEDIDDCIDIDEQPEELDDFFGKTEEDIFKDLLPIPTSFDTGLDGDSQYLPPNPAPAAQQSAGTTTQSFLDVQDMVLDFANCTIGADNCPGRFEQGKVLNEPPAGMNGTSLGVNITTGIAPWKVVTFLKRGDSMLTNLNDTNAMIITNINTSPYATTWQGHGTPGAPYWVGPPDGMLENSEYVAGYELGFAVHEPDLIMITANYRSSGELEIVVQDDKTIAALVKQDCGNANNSFYSLQEGVMLDKGFYRLRVAVKNNDHGPAVFWMQGTIASMTPHNLLLNA